MIHPTAQIAPGAQIADNVTIGPYSVVDGDVIIGAGCRIGGHVVIREGSRIGVDNQIFSYASIGEIPQDKKYAGENVTLHIGARNTIREFCTINRGTQQDRGQTTLGDDNWIMAYVHIAHDCVIGNQTIIANSVQLGGHVLIEDYAFLGGATLVHQFCRVGAHAITAMGSKLYQDVIPFIRAAGHERTKANNINTEGLRRRGFSPARIASLRQAYKIIFRANLSLAEALARLRSSDGLAGNDDIQCIIRFIEGTRRTILR